MRVRLAAAMTGALVAVSLIACSTPQPSRAPVNVTLYGRNAAPSTAWFATQPLTNPISAIGFGPDLGYACWRVPTGSTVVLLDHAPSETNPAAAIREVAAVDPAIADPVVLWVDVAAGGTITSGSGVPPWWPLNGGGC